MNPDEMQASDEDQRCKDELAKIEMNRLKKKKMSQEARNQMFKMKLKLSSVASVGRELSALKAIGFTEAASVVFSLYYL